MISVGGIVLSDAHAPEEIPLGGELAAKDITLSDGTRILKVTGYTPQDFDLAGTIHPSTGPDSAIKVFEQLEQMAISHQPQTFMWGGDRVRRSFTVIVRKVTGKIARHNEVDYTIQLFRGARSGFAASGYVAQSPATTSQQQNALRSVAASVGPDTRGYVNAALLAAANVQHRGN